MISWEEFQSRRNEGLTTFDTDYEPTEIECPQCKAQLFKYIRVVLATYPPQYRYDCRKCGWSGTA